ncbi:MAG TPA: PAS domain S-box protein [Kofleriaceae bacterium]|nr:PAS domain S-box protein [Kofleriaceae bacterium]
MASNENSAKSDPEIAIVATHTQSDDLFRLLVDTVKDYAIFVLDPRGYVATWNPGAERFKGYQADEIIGRHFSTFYPEIDVKAGKCERELELAARDGRFEDEGWRVRKDGSQFWANVVITALRDGEGRLIGFGKVTRDLTERMLAERTHLEAERRLRLLIESVQDYAIFALDANGNVATWNPGAERIKGYRADEIIGRHFSTFYPEADVQAGKCEHGLEVAARIGRFETEGWRVRKDGTQFWANVVISAVRDETGAVVGYSKVTRDLTERRRVEEERAARIAAEQANRTKDEFLAMLGHELRNPLAPIVTAIQLLKIRGDTRSMREIQIIERQVNQMTRLVDDLLDVSRIARGKIVLVRKRIDLRDVLAKAAEISIPSIDSKRQRFEVDVPMVPILVEGDEARLVQVFANLLNNASKYTPVGGRIELAVRHDPRTVSVIVQDSGRGIDPALLPRVFDLFVQGYQEADRAEGGLGIGLTLVRSLVELHGGDAQAHSEGVNRGTTMTIRLPSISDGTVDAPREPDRSLSHAYHAPALKRRILLVDDNEDARWLLADVLGALGHAVTTAGDGPAALAMIEDQRPDVVLLDIGLPGMDGFELAKEIRERYGNSIRLIAVTGYGRQVDHARSKEAGIDVHMVKPVDVQKLVQHIAER